MKKLLVLFFLFFTFFPAFSFKVFANYPNYKGYVNDLAGVLSSQTAQSLESQLSIYDKQTTNQVVVVTIDSTNPETIEEYSINLAEKWKVGQKGKDNGVIMIFAMKDRAMRIEVGRGLEGDLTDIQSKHILDDIIRPYFKKGDYEKGIIQGIDTVIATLSHTITPVSKSSNTSEFEVITFFVIVFTILFLAYSPFTPLGGRGVWGVPTVWGDFRKRDGDNSGFGGFGGGSFSGGGSSSRW